MPRSYDSSVRAEQAQETRRRIVNTAKNLLLGGGYASMTVATLARAAGVSPQTVYNSIGGKADVVKAVYDVMMAGDDDAVPMPERPEFKALFEAEDSQTFARAYARWIGLRHSMVGELLGSLTVHGVDASLVEFLATTERERRAGNTFAINGMKERIGLPSRVRTKAQVARLIDGVWALTAPDIYDRLVNRSGWSRKQYDAWLAAQLTVLIC